jgi:Fe-S-cluster containining protein
MAKLNGSSAAASGAPLELTLLPQAHPCHDCGQCCHYIATQIDNPSSFKDYENLHWYLLHRDICVYVDWEGDWYLEFKTPCRHLTAAKTCGIYEERPHICSEFSWTECEVTTRERAWKHRFETYDQLLAWMQVQRPKSYRRYVAARRKLVRDRQRESEPPRVAAGGAAEADS